MYENVIMAGEFANVDQHYLNQRRESEKEQLSAICDQLNEMTGGEINVLWAVSELPLIRSILEIIKLEGPVMILK